MTTTPDRTAALRAVRAKDSQDKRRRVLAALQALETAGTPVTAAAVAATAGVSTWLVYADGVREHLDTARRRQAGRGTTPIPAVPADNQAPVTPASLRTDLAIAREQIRLLRTERDKLLSRLRLQLGAEIEGPERADLISRVANLEAVGRQLAAERDARTAEATQAQRHVQELQDDLTAARDSLRKLIKTTNR